MKMVPLGELYSVNMGQSPESSSYNKGGLGLPFFQGNADFGEMCPNVRVWCTSPKKIVEAGTLLISVRAPIGALNFVRERSCIGRGVAGISANDICSLRFLYYVLRRKNAELNRMGTGSTFKAISKAALENVLTPKMDDESQKFVVFTLDTIQSILSHYKQQLELLDTLVKARFAEMFGDPVINPRKWNQVTINDVCSSIVRGPFGSALKKEFFVEPSENTYKVYEQKHAIQKNATIGTYYITENKYQELKRFECISGDILMSCSGTIGELYQLPDGCERGIINQALCKFTLNEQILPVYFLTYMKQTIDDLETKGSGIQNIVAVSYVKAMHINLPPIELQNEFADFVHQVEKTKADVQKSLDKTQMLFDSLMQEYFG